MSQADTVGGAPSLPESQPPTAAATARPRPAGPSLRPALAVVAVALFFVLAFGIGAALTRNGPSKPPSPSRVAGTGLVAEPAVRALHPIEILGTPPADVLDSLVLPKGVRRLSVTRWSGSAQFDGKASFRARTSQGVLVRFFRSQLRAHGWSIVNVGPARVGHGATEVLAQRPSNDGWFWEAGFVVFPTSFGSAVHADATRFSLDLYEMPDAT